MNAVKQSVDQNVIANARDVVGSNLSFNPSLRGTKQSIVYLRLPRPPIVGLAMTGINIDRQLCNSCLRPAGVLIREIV